MAEDEALRQLSELACIGIATTTLCVMQAAYGAFWDERKRLADVKILPFTQAELDAFARINTAIGDLRTLYDDAMDRASR